MWFAEPASEGVVGRGAPRRFLPTLLPFMRRFPGVAACVGDATSSIEADDDRRVRRVEVRGRAGFKGGMADRALPGPA